MEDNFDKILSNKIKEVFEKSVVPYNPEHWKMLVAKKKKQHRKVIFFWRFAGILLLFLVAGSLGKFLFDSSDSKNPSNPKVIIDDKNNLLRTDTLIDNNTYITKNKTDSLNTDDSRDTVTIFKRYISKSNAQPKIYITSIENHIPENRQNSKNNDVIILSDSLKIKNAIASNELLQTKEKLNNNNVDSENVILNNDDIVINSNKINEKNQKQIKKELVASLEEESTSEEAEKKSIKLGVNLSPILNYNQENENSTIGFAGGVSVEFPISKNFDISTGVLYTNQKLNLNTYPSYYGDALSNVNLTNNFNNQLESKDAIIKGIEIPIALKYNFSIVKKDVFISAGFSSTSYFKENIEANYIVTNRTENISQDSFGNNIIQYNLVKSDKKVITPTASNNFNFASILNVSFGVEFPIKKQYQSIIIEPYFKYSLIPVTQEKVDFSSAGIFIRYNFSMKRN
ncbi:outer membrane beta-barrel protein [Lutibacter sp.]|uniref:outer membrane beta-barrel protein n=1 Tax=Lutibacter sp. TaxID=1925666 RepID=UPI002736EC62|nr:outer membrane beta-barrel protein [Lutibacter sp.]MDP3314066.1 outer membrane beta-barrel protein [Lutibacter sp.]